jgi:hypothetical protein
MKEIPFAAMQKKKPSGGHSAAKTPAIDTYEFGCVTKNFPAR